MRALGRQGFRQGFLLLQSLEGLDTQLGHTGSRLSSQEGEGLGWGAGSTGEPVQSSTPPPPSSS